MKTDKQKVSFLNPGEINDTTNKTGPFKQKKTNSEHVSNVIYP